jgi:hypothetical protein
LTAPEQIFSFSFTVAFVLLMALISRILAAIQTKRSEV